MKVYCEHAAITREIKSLRRTGKIEVLHFPYDPSSAYRLRTRLAVPSGAQIRDMGCTIAEAGEARIGDFVGSEHLAAILRIVGPSNRRDALHVDSAYKSGCDCIVTADSDIASVAADIETLLGLRVFHRDDPCLRQFLVAGASVSRRCRRTPLRGAADRQGVSQRGDLP